MRFFYQYYAYFFLIIRFFCQDAYFFLSMRIFPKIIRFFENAYFFPMRFFAYTYFNKIIRIYAYFFLALPRIIRFFSILKTGHHVYVCLTTVWASARSCFLLLREDMTGCYICYFNKRGLPLHIHIIYILRHASWLLCSVIPDFYGSVI